MGAQAERDARMLRRFGGFDQETVLGTIKPGRGSHTHCSICPEQPVLSGSPVIRQQQNRRFTGVRCAKRPVFQRLSRLETRSKPPMNPLGLGFEEPPAIRRVTVAQQIARRSVPRERFGYLAGEPSRRRHSSCGNPLTHLVYSGIFDARETDRFPVRLGRFAPRFARHP
jgi:hypothetical protein